MIAISDKHITAVKTILTFLNWRRLGKFAILALLSTLLVFLWLSRDSLFSAGFNPTTTIPLLRISPGSKEVIETIVHKSDRIVAIQVITINFQKNIRVDTYSSIDDPRVESIYKEVNNNRIVEIPLFDDSKSNNNKVLRLINGEFVCMPYSEYIAYKYAPEIERYVGHVCSIGIPPGYGNFSGILTMYLKDTPNKEDTEQIFLLSRNLSFRIFNDNIINENNK